MEWLNEPASWQKEGDKVIMTADAKTDFWRKTRHDFIVDNGHFYFQPVTGNFTASVKVTGDYRALYDQAGMMLRLDEMTWVKCGIEFMEGVQYASAVVTRQFSDWSIVPLTGSPKSMWFRVSRINEAVEVEYSLDGKDYQMFRQAYFTEAETIQVGLMCAAPQGDGFTATLEDFQIRQL
jgi:hypothetical protein